jgi:hypothetical protein
MRELADLLASPAHFHAVAIPKFFLGARSRAGYVDIGVYGA